MHVASVCALTSPSVCVTLYLSGVPGFQCVGPVCHQVHAKRDVQSATVSTEVPAVCHGGCGRAEQPCPVSTYVLLIEIPTHFLYYSLASNTTYSNESPVLKCIGEKKKDSSDWLTRFWLAGRSQGYITLVSGQNRTSVYTQCQMRKYCDVLIVQPK